MKRELVGKSYTVNVRLRRVIDQLVFTIPFFMIAYGLAISDGYVAGSHYFSQEAFIGIAVITGTAIITQAVTQKRSTRIRILYLILHHVLLASGLLLIFGILGPATLAWLLLIVITLMYFGRRWAFLSYLLLVATITTYLAISEGNIVGVSVQAALYVVLILALAVMFSTLRSSEFKEQEKVAAAEARQKEQREALLTIINGASQAIFTINGNGTIRIYNAALLSLVDTNDSLSGKNIDDVLALQRLDGEPVQLRSLIKDSPNFERDDFILKFADGDEIRLRISVNKTQTAFSASHKSGNENYVCIARDVTKEKSLEEERDEFISVVSHELRTPVAITEGTLSNLQYFLEKGANPDKLKQSISTAHDQIIMLSNMINDLGTLSRAEQGVGDSPEEINLKELAEAMYKNYEPSASKKGLRFNIDAGTRLGTLTTSRLYLEEALQNFITNAIKYTAEGSVTLRLSRRGSDIEFAVVDTGIGISKTDLKRVFEKFYRSEDYRTRETSGTGLGLYVVTKLMHKLGTRVEVTSRLNHGSTFSFVLRDKPSKPKA